MLRLMKNTGKVQSRAKDSAKGNKGRVDLGLTVRSDGDYDLSFIDFGNYGKNRWDVSGVLTVDDLKGMRKQLDKLIKGEITQTLEAFVVPEPAPKAAPAPEASASPAAPAAEATPAAAGQGQGQRRRRKKQESEETAAAEAASA